MGGRCKAMISRNTRWREKLNEIFMTNVPISQGSISADGSIVNWITGVIQSHYVGLLRAGVRVKVGGHADLRVRWTMENDRQFTIGQQVVAAIPAEAVRFESGLF